MFDRFSKIISYFFPKGSRRSGVGVLLGGAASGQLIIILAAPVLTRLYSPEDFGYLAVFVAILSLLTEVSAGRFELAIPLPKANSKAFSVLVLASLCVVFSSLMSIFGVWIWSECVGDVFKLPELHNYLWLVPLGVFFIGMYQVFNNWAIREKNFPHIAKTRIYQSIGTVGLQIATSPLGPFGLYIGQVAGQSIGSISLGLAAFKNKRKEDFTRNGVISAAKRYRELPLYSSWTALLNTTSQQVAPVILLTFFGAQVSGYYALTLRVLSGPIGLVGNAVSGVFISEAPEAQRKGELADLVENFHTRLLLIGVPPLVLAVMFSPDVFSVIFGEEWRKAGIYASLMAPWIYMQLQWTPISTISIVLELQKQLLVFNFFSIFASVGCLVVSGYISLRPEHTIAVFSATCALVYSLRSLWFLKKAGLDLKRVAIWQLLIVSFSFFQAAVI